MQQDPNTPGRGRGRPFRPGPDPRRHKFSREECQHGFWAVVESITRRYPGAVTTSHVHMSRQALPALLKRRNAGGGR